MINIVPSTLSIQNMLGTILILIIIYLIERIANRVWLVYHKSKEKWTKDIPQDHREGSFTWVSYYNPLGNSYRSQQALWWMMWQQKDLKWSQAANGAGFVMVGVGEAINQL